MLIHIRYDEVALKGENRSFFERRLKKNLLRLIGGAHIRRTRGRLIVRVPDERAQEALAAAGRCFGVASASPIRVVEKTEAAIAEAAVAIAREAQARGVAKTFKVEARRQDKTFPIASNVLAPRIGGAVLTALPGAFTVNVHKPDLVIGIEIAKDGAALHALSIDGPGGMPVSTAGKALALLSGGIDSPVAAWYGMKRGLRVDHVYFHAFPFTGDKAKEKVLELARILSRWSPDAVHVHVLSTTKIQEAIANTREDGRRVVILRRFMYRLAARVADRFKHRVLLTGEAVGQVASQTIPNLRCVEAVVPNHLVLRPLIGFDKREIIARARLIGTFETSTLPYEDCCALFAPRHPTTNATNEGCAEVESKLDVKGLEDESMAGLEAWRIVRGGEPVKVALKEAPVEDEDDEPEAAAPAEGAVEAEDVDEPAEAGEGS